MVKLLKMIMKSILSF